MESQEFSLCRRINCSFYGIRDLNVQVRTAKSLNVVENQRVLFFGAGT